MNLVTLEEVSKHYGVRRLLDHVGLLINEGDRIGLIGPNGSGKTTLLRIIAGLEPPDGGTVTVWGGVRIQFLPQEPVLQDDLSVLAQVFNSDAPQIQLLRDYEAVSAHLQQQPQDPQLQEQLVLLSAEMERSGGWAAEAQAKAVLTRLGIDQFDKLVGTLSGGERKRVALAQALLDPVDLLILDEPTNHIDAETIDWLEGFLTGMNRALLMVTHDRYFLDRVANRIVELDRQQLVSYPGNYSRYLELRAQRETMLATKEWKQQRLLARELRWLQRGAAARTTKQKARQERIADLEDGTTGSGEDRVVMALASRRLGKKVLEVEGVSKAYGSRLLFHDVNLTLTHGERIGIVGPNGVGKTTFLDIIAGETTPDTGEVVWGPTVELGYYDQRNRGLVEDMKVIDFITKEASLVRTPDGQRVEAAQMLEWFLFSRPQQQAYISSLSGGERRRLYLLSILVHQPNVLLLDEPTNDLDIQTLTVLESFMDRFAGCLLVVSHDRYFLDRTVDYLATFEDGKLSARYPAPFSSFLRLRRQQAEERTAAKPPAQRRGARQLPAPKTGEPERQRKLSYKEQRELEQLSTRVDELEKKQTRLQAEANNIGNDYERLPQLAAELEAVERELEQVMERWLELSEVAEG